MRKCWIIEHSAPRWTRQTKHIVSIINAPTRAAIRNCPDVYASRRPWRLIEGEEAHADGSLLDGALSRIRSRAQPLMKPSLLLRPACQVDTSVVLA